MRLRNVKNKQDILSNSTLLITDLKDLKGNWKTIFNNDNPIYIEIGMGKGDFILENALTYPNINFIGIEKYDSIVARAIQKIEGRDDIPSNLKLLRMDAKVIDEVFSKEVDRIYLNFSDPWPKNRHSERRLTSKTFLDKYEKIFKNDNEIIMKTDNTNLFEYSLVTLSTNGYHFDKVSLDLHNSDVESNIMTEYEKKFVEKNIKINYLVAIKKVSNK
ncbi:MAG: tRNA (guanosine(46)-N7)-methyltransferase TrmB [Bacilli bacterium]|nr:tRNA (guanosine(46)-N7)-methyltransferase TrmB [Bacilli bacterium]